MSDTTNTPASLLAALKPSATQWVSIATVLLVGPAGVYYKAVALKYGLPVPDPDTLGNFLMQAAPVVVAAAIAAARRAESRIEALAAQIAASRATKAFLPLFMVASLALGGCSTLQTINNASTATVSPVTIQQAQQTLNTIKLAYAAFQVPAVLYTSLPVCGAPGVTTNLCANATAVADIAKVDSSLNSAIASAQSVISNTTVSTTDLQAGISVLQAAWSTFQTSMATWNVAPQPAPASAVTATPPAVPAASSSGG